MNKQTIENVDDYLNEVEIEQSLQNCEKEAVSIDITHPLYGKEEFFEYIIDFCKNEKIDLRKVFIEKDFTVFD